MSDAIHIPEIVQHLIEERARIWQEFEVSKQQGNELNVFVPRIPAGPIEVLPPLTPEQKPHQEVNQALIELRSTLQQVDQMKNDILNSQQEIARINAQAKSMAYMMGCAVFVVIGGLILFVVLALS